MCRVVGSVSTFNSKSKTIIFWFNLQISNCNLANVKPFTAYFWYLKT